MKKLLEVLEHDSLPKIKELLKQNSYDLNSDVVIGQEYDLDEHDEIPLLFYAIQTHISLEAIELLIEHGMQLDYTNKEGLGAIDIAIKHRRKDVIELLRSHNIDITKSKRKSGLTPLMLAAGFNDIDLMEFLIEQGADATIRDKYGMNALDYAHKMGQKKSVEFLEKLQKN